MVFSGKGIDARDSENRRYDQAKFEVPTRVVPPKESAKSTATRAAEVRASLVKSSKSTILAKYAEKVV